MVPVSGGGEGNETWSEKRDGEGEGKEENTNTDTRDTKHEARDNETTSEGGGRGGVTRARPHTLSGRDDVAVGSRYRYGDKRKRSERNERKKGGLGAGVG